MRSKLFFKQQVFQVLFQALSHALFHSIFFQKKKRQGHFKMDWQTVRKVGCILLGLMLLYGYCAHHFIIVKNTTESLPYSFFVLKRQGFPCADLLQKDAYILFTHAKTQIPMIKQVKGVPGSVICLDAFKKLWVDDFCVGVVREITSTGKPLSPIHEKFVPPGYVFVYASHERSFDSRYQEMGLVPIAAIQGVGMALSWRVLL
jgi:conjugal transfer pilin signal peptidase TrbI